VFWPRPKVFSAFLQITLDEQLRQRIPDRDFFHDFLRTIFCHRRKSLRGQLVGAGKGQLDKSAADAILAEQQLDGTLRAEQLPVDAMLRLCETVRKATSRKDTM
jgi:16S rRNA (adenine1518-N6/adenine1519-N6)-dimethyltransferase